MSNQGKFLSLYKEYEGLLRNEGKDPKEIEDQSADAERLRLCRQFRNYMSHVQDPGFIDPTDKMMKFLSGQVNELKQKGDVVKKYLKKPEACIAKESDKIQDVTELFRKLKCQELLVQKSDGSWAMTSVFDIIGLKGTAKVSILRLRAVQPCWCGPMDEFKQLDPDRVWLCTDDGTKDGKLLGRVWV